jgi:hypothetical protein
MQTSKSRGPVLQKSTSSSNESFGFLSGHENGKKTTQRSQRRQQFRKNNPTPPLNTGSSGTMITSPDKPSITVKPTSNISQSIALPPDIQDKINRWREKRLKQDQPTKTTPPIQQTRPSTSPIQLSQVRGRLDNKSVIQPPPTLFVTDDMNNFISEEDDQHVQDEVENSTSNLSGVSSLTPQQLTVPQPLQLTSSQTLPQQTQLKSISLFDPQQQEIMRGQVEFEVKRVLDQLKKERPELTNQADIMNTVNQKTRIFEESLQQFNVREQRLRDMVDQMNVTIKAVQSNVDNTKAENGGQFVTEDVMKSWVSFFLGEQMANIKTELRSDIVRLNEKTTQQSSDLKTLETTVHLLETKLQNTLQTIFESVLSVRGSVLNQVSSYESTNVDSSVRNTYNTGDELVIMYPIVKIGEDRWMKVKTVDSTTAQLSEAWIPVLLNQVPLVGNFKL